MGINTHASESTYTLTYQAMYRVSYIHRYSISVPLYFRQSKHMHTLIANRPFVKLIMWLV